MVAITLQWDRSLLRQVEHGFPKALVRALSKAGGDAIRTLRTSSSKRVRERKRLKAGRVKRGLPLTFPRGTQHVDDLTWSMGVEGAPARLSSYPFRQTKRGVSISVNRGARRLVAGAFVATLKSGHVGIFKRRGPARLPIDELLTSRISDVFKDDGMIPALQRATQAKFAATFARVLPLEVAKARSGGVKDAPSAV